MRWISPKFLLRLNWHWQLNAVDFAKLFKNFSHVSHWCPVRKSACVNSAVLGRQKIIKMNWRSQNNQRWHSILDATFRVAKKWGGVVGEVGHLPKKLKMWRHVERNLTWNTRCNLRKFVLRTNDVNSFKLSNLRYSQSPIAYTFYITKCYENGGTDAQVLDQTYLTIDPEMVEMGFQKSVIIVIN